MSSAVNVADVIHNLEARGARLVLDGPDIVVRPAGVLTASDREALRARKSEARAVLKARDLGADWTRLSLYQLNKVLEVSVPWADVPIIIAPGCRVAKGLRELDSSPGRVWCTCEVLDLLLPGVSPDDARKVAEGRLMFAGTVTGVHQ